MRIGILGGTFDPFHQGHLFLARQARRWLLLDQVWLMVARTSPLKQSQNVTSSHHRFAMAAIATRHDPELLVSDWELQREGISYTIETMESLSRRLPDHQFCFLAGGDALQEIHSWRDCDRLLREHCFVFVPRPGVELDWNSLGTAALTETIREPATNRLPALQGGRSYLLPLSPPVVSSSQIRRLLKSGSVPSEQQLPHSVHRYIRKHRLYEKNQTHSR